MRCISSKYLHNKANTVYDVQSTDSIIESVGILNLAFLDISALHENSAHEYRGTALSRVKAIIDTKSNKRAMLMTRTAKLTSRILGNTGADCTTINLMIHMNTNVQSVVTALNQTMYPVFDAFNQVYCF